MDNSLVASDIAAGFAALAKNEYSTARAAFEHALSKGGGDDALVHLGGLLEQGLGGEKDVTRAIKLYRQALETGAADLAAYHLGLLLMKQEDRREGRKLLQRSADSGNPSAAYWLYAYCSESNDIDSLALADQSLLRAAELGHAYALRDIAGRRMRTSQDLGARIAARVAYWKAKAVGILLTIRNAHDWRIR
jgi:TPR repeat protein